MYYRCQCGTSVHLNRKEEIDDPNKLELNMMCFSCFQEQQPSLFKIRLKQSILGDIIERKVWARTKIGTHHFENLTREYFQNLYLSKMLEYFGTDYANDYF